MNPLASRRPETGRKSCNTQQPRLFITDAYSTRYESELDYEQVQVSSLDDLIQETLIQKTAVDAGQSLSKILDVWNEVAFVSGEIQEGQLRLSGKMNLCLLAADSQGVPFYLEKMADFTLNRAWSGPENSAAPMYSFGAGAVRGRWPGRRSRSDLL